MTLPYFLVCHLCWWMECSLFSHLMSTWSLRRLSDAEQFWLAASRLVHTLLPTRGTSWLLEIMAEWAEISAQAIVLSLLKQQELLSLLHHLVHQGTVLSKVVITKQGFVLFRLNAFFLVSTHVIIFKHVLSQINLQTLFLLLQLWCISDQKCVILDNFF